MGGEWDDRADLLRIGEREGGAIPGEWESGMLGQFPENGMMVPVFLEWKRNAL